MKKQILPLTENHLFSKAYTKGKCEATKYIAVYLLRNFKKNPDGSPMKTRLGITVNRKLGKACKRNRVKRLVRAAYRENYPLVRDGYFLIIAARSAAFAPYVKSGDISRSLRNVLSKEDFFDMKAKSSVNRKKSGSDGAGKKS